ncbi:hypothetical protein pdam_00018896 [Pocillopora damicornis]|uniref:SUEL-type lectin domain-containing protein n=1 Tax=Pocillopora damicornis TaxID=46731 RepID=A0A3M6UBI9_POCDA|nr:hypothetical protein pdam_00018896 [Pocillopora damicornis]
MRAPWELRFICWCLSWLFTAFGFPFESNLTEWVRQANATALGCEGHMLTLSCAGQEEGLKINSAFWGRNDLKTCIPDKPREQMKMCSPVEPLYAVKKLRHVCEGQPTCGFPVSDAFFEKPLCPGVSKFLKVVYDCRMMSGMGAK